MKKQLLAFAIFTLGFITISEAKNKNRERYAEVVKGGTIIIKSKNPPVVPPGCTVSRYKKRWKVTNNSGETVRIRRK